MILSSPPEEKARITLLKREVPKKTNLPKQTTIHERIESFQDGLSFIVSQQNTEANQSVSDNRVDDSLLQKPGRCIKRKYESLQDTQRHLYRQSWYHTESDI